MKDFAKYSDIVFYASFVGVILAAYGAFAGSDIWLAPTQWLMVAAAIVAYAIYLKLSAK
jgi:hypothetical protein